MISKRMLCLISIMLFVPFLKGQKEISEILENKREMEIYLNRILTNYDTLALDKLINESRDNLEVLLEFSLISESENHDQISFKNFLDDYLEKPSVKFSSYYYHFRLVFELQEKSIPYIVKDHPTDYPWWPWYLDEYVGSLLIFRHLLLKYFPDEQYYYEKDQYWQEFVLFLLLRYRDNSILEVKHLDYSIEFIESWKNNPGWGVNIRNSEIQVVTSSLLSEKYSPSNMLDYDLYTAWAEGANSEGIGEWIEITLSPKIEIDKVILFPGYGKSEKLFTANNRLKKVKVEWNHQTKIVEFEDLFCAQDIDIKDKTDKIKLTVLEVFKGNKYNDLCISEIMLTKPFSDY